MGSPLRSAATTEGRRMAGARALWRANGMREDRLWHCSTHDEIVKVLKKVVRKGDVVLLKGSRSMKREKVLEKMR